MLKELLKLSNGKELDVKFPIRLFNSKGNFTYYEDSDKFWSKSEFDSNGNETYYETSTGFWSKSEYDSNGNLTYFEDSSGYWSKSEFDSNGKCTYFENSDGTTSGSKRQETIELTVADIEKLLNKKIKIVKE